MNEVLQCCIAALVYTGRPPDVREHVCLVQTPNIVIMNLKVVENVDDHEFIPYCAALDISKK